MGNIGSMREKESIKWGAKLFVWEIILEYRNTKYRLLCLTALI